MSRVQNAVLIFNLDFQLKNNKRLCAVTVIPGATEEEAPVKTQDIPFILWRLTVDKRSCHVEQADSDCKHACTCVQDEDSVMISCSND
jgi:hypothetical protein